MTALPVPSMTEDYKQAGLDIDVVQYNHRDFGFWSGDNINRNVARYQTSFKFERFGVLTPSLDFELDQETDEEKKVLNFPAVFTTRTVGDKSVNTLQEWECVVTEVADDSVTALANSMLNRDEEQNYIVIPLREFMEADRLLLCPGVVFRLIVGFTQRASGMRTREALIYIRKELPRRTLDISAALGVLVD